MKKQTCLLLKTAAVCILVLGVFVSPTHASNWAGGTGNWSSTTSPGWTVGGVPNAVGAVADFSGTTTGTTTQDVASLTVGTISISGSSSVSRTLTLTNAITLNQDGAGAGTATISNSNSNTGTTNAIIFSSGASGLTLADNLLVSNTGGSTRTTGSIQLNAVIGGTGNITLSNVSNNTGAGQIFFNATNTFTGTVLVQKGATTFSNAASFGNVAGNTITIGQSGQGSATLLSTAAATMANNWVIASGSGGTLVFGSQSVSAVNFNGTGTLNGDLTFTAASAGANYTKLGGVISGAGGIIKIGSGNGQLSQAVNTYTGATTIDNGVLQVAALAAVNTNSSIGKGSSGGSAADLVFGGGTLQYLGSTATTTNRLFTIGDTTGLTATLDASGTGVGTMSFTGTGALGLGGSGARTLNLVGSNTGNNTLASVVGDGTGGTTSVTKSGAGTWVVSGANSFGGTTTVSAGTLVVSGGGLTTTSGITVSGGSLKLGASSILNNAATLTLSGGTLDAQTFSNSLGALTLSGNSFISLGSGGTIAFADSSAATWGSFTIDITGFVSGSSLRFGTNSSGLAGGQLLKFTATGVSSFGLDSSGYLTSVPEPSTWALLTFSLTTVMVLRRRRSA